MAFKAVVILCAQALLAHVAFSQCLGSTVGRAPYGLAGPGLGLAGPGVGLASPGLGHAYAGCAGVSSTGGGFPVTSASPIAPTGVSVVSENAIEGALSVEGNLPLLGSVGLEGAFPTAGAGAVSYGCGNDGVAITSESPIATGILAPGPVGPAPGLATGPGLPAGLGLGLGRGYNGVGLGINRPCGSVY